ncbi:putative ATP-dependent RNA helicase TDRD9-like protein [Leptotrombidium deliense]|uniref:Probable ATP-dependent RNA helicase spindle-E n=1 Tax=Leptotrombidium deliense TaxID=299467 RepID=A0A443SLV6_9ACAR|nr:putative ATP-dependent RNA helicase TDRD9-like protein [Leptotrombidium deliense]
MAFSGLGRGRGFIRNNNNSDASSSNAGPGRNSLFTIDPNTGLPDVNEVLNFSRVPANVFDQFFQIGGDVQLPSYDFASNNFGVKKIKQEPPDVKPKLNQNQEKEYVAEVVHKEREEALLCQRLRMRDLDPNSVNTLASSTTNLDAVSTVICELNIPQTEEVKVALQPFFDPSKRRTTQRLKIAEHREKILNSVKMNQVTIIEGSTGCGKTTQVPQYIADDCYDREQDFNIVITQPRRIAAISVAKRVCAERDWNLGELVGYQVGMDKKVNENTRILYCTTGVLLQKLITVKKVDHFTHIIIDEVHERNEEVDLLLMVVRKFMWTHHANIRIIIMSATFDTTALQDYFAIPNPGNLIHSTIKPVVVQIPEKQHYTSLFYLNQLVSLCKTPAGVMDVTLDPESPGITYETMEVAYRLIKSLDDVERNQSHQYGRGAVLVFLPGYEEINELKSKLESDREKSLNWWVLPLHSTITVEEQQKVFETATRGNRKIILATNIAESSITVTDIEYVIDFCLTKNLICDPDTQYPCLRLEWASKASCTQRQGRAGRVREGRCYRLVTSEFYDRHLPDYPTPELLRIPLEHSVLKVKRLDLGQPKELLGLCLDPPNLSDINRAVLRLKKVGGLTTTMNGVYDVEDGVLTAIGDVMAILPIDVQLTRLVLMGHAFDCLNDCCIVAACLTMQNMFSRQYNREVQSYKSKLAWADRTFSDPLAYYNAFKFYSRYIETGVFTSNSKKAKEWCDRTFIQHKRIREVELLYKEILQRLSDKGIRLPEKPNVVRDESEEEFFLKICICGAFYPNYFTRLDVNADDVRRDLHDKDPRTTVKISNLPQNEGVLYANQIRRLFQECSDQINLEFEESHALLTFSSDKNPLEEAKKHQSYLDTNSVVQKKSAWRDTDVKTSVYVAMKLKQLGLPLKITLYKKERRKELLEQYITVRNAKVESNNILRTHRYSVPATPTSSIDAPKLPGRDVRIVKVFVTHVETCGHFWAQYYTEDVRETLDLMRKAIKAYNGKEVTRLTEGMIVLAPVSQQRTEYSRARVDHIHDRFGISLFYLDYGNREIKADKSGIMELPLNHPSTPSILKIPGLAMEFKLSEIKPSECLTYDDSWVPAATDYFVSQITNRVDLEFKIYSVVNKVIRGELMITTDNRNINHELINEQFAEYCSETAQSQEDNAYRMGVSLPGHSSQTLRATLEAVEVDVAEPENNVLSKESIRIRGPFSPIESSFQGLTKMTYSVKIGVERDSVNSICLEPNLEEAANRLLVAANVTIGSGSNRMVARNTTLMPCIKGFATLMALMFSPCVEFRPDFENNRYLGAICGLGFDPRTKESFDPEGDITLNFDILLSNADIGLINMIRLKLSDTLSSLKRLEESFGPPFFKRQEAIRSTLKNLLTRKRIKQEVEYNKRADFRWGLVPESKTEIPPDQFFEDVEHPFLPLLRSVKNVDANLYVQRIINNLEELALVVRNKISARAHCLVCNKKSYTLIDLQTHLNTKAHLDKVMEHFPNPTERNVHEDVEFDID